MHQIAVDRSPEVIPVQHQPELRHRFARAGQEMILVRFTLERMVDEMGAWLEGIVR